MPWEIKVSKDARDGKPFKIVKKATGEVVGSSSSRAKAEASIKARYAGMDMEGQYGGGTMKKSMDKGGMAYKKGMDKGGQTKTPTVGKAGLFKGGETKTPTVGKAGLHKGGMMGDEKYKVGMHKGGTYDKAMMKK